MFGGKPRHPYDFVGQANDTLLKMDIMFGGTPDTSNFQVRDSLRQTGLDAIYPTYMPPVQPTPRPAPAAYVPPAVHTPPVTYTPPVTRGQTVPAAKPVARVAPMPIKAAPAPVKAVAVQTRPAPAPAKPAVEVREKSKVSPIFDYVAKADVPLVDLMVRTQRWATSPRDAFRLAAEKKDLERMFSRRQNKSVIVSWRLANNLSGYIYGPADDNMVLARVSPAQEWMQDRPPLMHRAQRFLYMMGVRCKALGL